MYIEKSTICKCIIMAGMVILIAVAFLYCFSETEISGSICMAIWFACVCAVSGLVKKVESI